MNKPLFEPPTLDELAASEGESPADDHLEDEPRRPTLEELTADPLTVQGRKRGSAWFASLSALVSRSGIPDACRALNELERAKARRDPAHKIVEYDAAELLRVCMVLMEVMQKAEADAEGAGRPCPKLRRARVAAYQFEAAFRREPVPYISEVSAEDRARIVASLSRAWYRRWKKLHTVQCFLHLAFFTREDGAAGKSGKVAPAVTDRMIDLVAQTAAKARGRGGNLVRRYNRAADEVLEEFRRDPASVYAPGWSVESAFEEAGESARGKAGADAEDDPLKSLRRVIGSLGKRAREVLADLPEGEADGARHALVALFAAELAEEVEPDPGGGRRVEREKARGVTLNSDTAIREASARVATATPVSRQETRESHETPAKEQKQPAPARHKTHVSDEGMADAEAAATLCASVGVSGLLVVGMDDTKRAGEEGSCIFSEQVTLSQFRARLPHYLKRNAESETLSLSVRLRTRDEFHVLQIDDVTPEQLERVRPFCFWVVATSPGNHQAWLAFSEKLDKSSYDETRSRLLRALNPTGDKEQANGGAGGAIRWPGSLNRKPKRRLADGTSPRVELVEGTPGRRVTRAELDAAGLLALPLPTPAPAPARSNVVQFSTGRRPDGWPSLDEKLSKFRKPDGSPDRSSAESSWACAALRMGWSEHEVESELSRITQKGRRRSDNYVSATVRHAADWLATQPRAGTNAGRERMVI
jgi:hypothetical protein